MIDVEYANAYVELLEILKYVSAEDYNRIPESKINLFKTNANPNYSFSYSPNKTLDEQHVSKRTKYIIAILFRDYWATEKQRDRIKLKEKYDILQLENKKRKQYDPNNIFKKNILENTVDNTNLAENITSLVVVKENIFSRFIKKLKYLFRRKK